VEKMPVYEIKKMIVAQMPGAFDKQLKAAAKKAATKKKAASPKKGAAKKAAPKKAAKKK
jgi:hypothetical protein